MTTIDDVISSPGDALGLFAVQPLFARFGGNHRLASQLAAKALHAAILAHEHVRKQARLLGRIARAEREYATGQYSDGPSAIASLKEQA